jgi:hypothetical protein
MKSFELMKLLIPENEVKAVSDFTGLNSSILYMERRESGEDVNSTGTRNTIDRLDLFCRWNLDRKNGDVVRLLADRYLRMYEQGINGPVPVPKKKDLLLQIGVAARQCGEAISALAGRKSLKDCEVEVAQARKALEHALAMVTAMEEQE